MAEEVNLHALLFADRVITEDNGKKGIIGVFNHFHFPSFPAISPPWFIFAQIDNIKKSKYEFTFNLAHERSQEVVFSGSGVFSTKEATGGADLALPVPNIRFSREGNYILSFVLDGKELGQRILKVFKREK